MIYVIAAIGVVFAIALIDARRKHVTLKTELANAKRELGLFKIAVSSKAAEVKKKL